MIHCTTLLPLYTIKYFVFGLNEIYSQTNLEMYIFFKFAYDR